jgi:hypothetical protein
VKRVDQKTQGKRFGRKGVLMAGWQFGRVLNAMLPFFGLAFVIPSGADAMGFACDPQSSEEGHMVAALIGGQEDEIVFTSSGFFGTNFVCLNDGPIRTVERCRFRFKPA